MLAPKTGANLRYPAMRLRGVRDDGSTKQLATTPPFVKKQAKGWATRRGSLRGYRFQHMLGPASRYSPSATMARFAP